MKRLYILVLSVISLNTASGQITLTSANNNPSIGDSFSSHIFDATLQGEGLSGANVVWDFSTLISQSQTYGSLQIVSNFTEGVNHPLANSASGDATSQVYIYSDNDEYSIAGTHIENTLRETFTDVKEYFKFPITYGNTFNETFSGSVNNIAVGQVFGRGGSVSIEADGYGTLILPYGTIYNVLRIRTTEIYSDTTGGIAFVSYVGERYSWFNVGTKTPILTHHVLTSSFGGPSSSIGSYLDQSSVVVGLGDEFSQGSSILMYPNPASNNFNITLDKVYNDASAQIMDVTGKVVKSEYIDMNIKELKFDLSDLDMGIYFVQIMKSGSVVFSEKLIHN
tara:strand:- start:1210 stop:2220 length:1011 start_codon:yes stop_codon:yes gene_type:complete